MAGRALSTDEQKRLFAKVWLQTGDPYKAAFFVWPDNEDTAIAVQAAMAWPQDDYVKGLRHAATPEGTPLLPSKFEAALAIWRRAEITTDPEAFAKLMKLYGEYLGLVEAAAKTSNTTNIQINNPKVLMMPSPQSVEQWSLETSREQAALILEGQRMNDELAAESA